MIIYFEMPSVQELIEAGATEEELQEFEEPEEEEDEDED
jgi:hypothetical protein